MIFYKSKAEDGRMVITGTQADARAVNKQFDQIDIPTDKAGLMAFVQHLMDEAALQGNQNLDAKAYQLCLEKAAALGFDNVLDALDQVSLGEPDGSGAAEEGSTPSLPQPDPHVKASLDFSAEVRRQISVEEEIQNCDLPRLATLASNVAWRYKELSEKCLSLPSDMT